MSLPESAIEFLAGLESRVRAARPKKRIVFPEGRDPRVAGAAERLARAGLIEPILLTGSEPEEPRYAQLYFERRRRRGVTEREAREIAARPLYRAALMVAAGDADGTVGGAANSTAETVRAALHAIGTAPGIRTVSSFFILALRDRSLGCGGLMIAADCAVIVEPTARELSDIAESAAATARQVCSAEPVIAMLPDDIGKLTQCNVIVFPNLNAANIVYKLVEWLGGAAAIGPMLQGLAKPANDLSRACSIDDVYSVALVTALQAG